MTRADHWPPWRAVPWAIGALAWGLLGYAHWIVAANIAVQGPLAVFADVCSAAAGGIARLDSPVWRHAVSMLPMFLLMSVAMMLPSVQPMATYIASTTLRSQRARATTLFLVSYLLVWWAYAVFASITIAALAATMRGVAFASHVIAFGHATPADLVMAATLALAASWHVSPSRLRVIGATRSPRPFPLGGSEADIAVMRFGFLHGVQCVAACWALMLVGAAVDSLAWMAAIGVLVWIERNRRNGFKLARPIALALALASLVYVVP
jgi:predicted metal-binding membrane protein